MAPHCRFSITQAQLYAFNTLVPTARYAFSSLWRFVLTIPRRQSLACLRLSSVVRLGFSFAFSTFSSQVPPTIIPLVQTHPADVLWFIGLELEADGNKPEQRKLYTSFIQQLMKKKLMGEELLLSRLENDVLQDVVRTTRSPPRPTLTTLTRHLKSSHTPFEDLSHAIQMFGFSHTCHVPPCCLTPGCSISKGE